jgi:bifunctional non-homologous end joining protein LigD
VTTPLERYRANRDSRNEARTTRSGTRPGPARARKNPAPAAARTQPNPEPFEFTHVEKVLFPDAGVRKADVIEYYLHVAGWLLPHLHDRPATLERLPEGIGKAGKPHFWQKNTPAYYPAWIPRVTLPSEAGKPVAYVVVNDAQTLAYLVNQGTLTFHVFLSRVQDLDRPDFVLFDLDPGKARFADAVTIASELRGVLDAEGIQSFLKTSGKTGLHVLVRWDRAGGYEEARGWAMGIARQIVRALPEIATIERSKAKRGSRVYVDVMQNARGLHVVPPYVIRAVPGAPVSTPLQWQELTTRLDPGKFDLSSIRRRLDRMKTDPMAALLKYA